MLPTEEAVQAYVDRVGPPPAGVRLRCRPASGPRASARRADGGALDVLLRRRTTRSFDRDDSLALSELAVVLRYVFGYHGYVPLLGQVNTLKRTSPSAAGSIRSRPTRGHGRRRARARALPLQRELNTPSSCMAPSGPKRRARRREFVCGQTYFADAHVLFVLAARFERAFWKYRNHRKAFAALLMDAAHLSQTLYLVATELGLGAFVTAAVNNADIEERLGIDGYREGVLAVCGFGRPAAEPSPFDPRSCRSCQGRRTGRVTLETATCKRETVRGAQRCCSRRKHRRNVRAPPQLSATTGWKVFMTPNAQAADSRPSSASSRAKEHCSSFVFCVRPPSPRRRNRRDRVGPPWVMGGIDPVGCSYGRLHPADLLLLVATSEPLTAITGTSCTSVSPRAIPPGVPTLACSDPAPSAAPSRSGRSAPGRPADICRAVAMFVVVVLVALIARELGAGRAGQAVAALAGAASGAARHGGDLPRRRPRHARLGHAGVCRDPDPGRWRRAPAAARRAGSFGIGLENKHLVLLLVLALTCGSPPQRWDLVRSRWLWVGAVLAFALLAAEPPLAGSPRWLRPHLRRRDRGIRGGSEPRRSCCRSSFC